MALHILDHPLARHHLTALRDARTPSYEFRRHLGILAGMLIHEASRGLLTEPVEIETPLCSMTGEHLAGRIGLIPILRAGLGMVDAALNLLPQAEVWHLGLYRDEETATPVHYYSKLPVDRPVDVAFILDPMLATGGSALTAIDALTDWGVSRIAILSVIASHAGVERLRETCPFVDIHTVGLDPELNDRMFIVPGLGDAGDRAFRTS